MKLNKKLKSIISLSLSVILASMSPGISELANSVPIAKAFNDTDSPIKENVYLSETEIKDTTLFSVLKVIANYTKARKTDSSLPELTGEENLLSDAYAAYKEDSFTFGELKAYNGPINLTPYAGKITSIEGLGYARGASSIDISSCTDITSIPNYEFANCSMTRFVMSNNVTTIGNSSFKSCSKLSQVFIDGEKYDADNSFIDLQYVTTIGNNAFEGCSSLNNIKLYEGNPELHMGIGAFINCTSLTSIELPVKNGSNLGESAFAGCENLSRIKLMDELDYIPVNIFSNTSINTVLIYNQTNTGNNYFPSELTYIGKNAFQGSTLATMNFTKSTKIKYIGEYAFAGASFTYLYLPEGLERIDALAFNGAFSYNKLTIPNSVKTIKERAFKSAQIYNIVISSNVSTIETETFAGSSLLRIEFCNTTDNPSKLTTIKDSAFKNCKYLYNINLDNNGSATSKLTSIGDEAFLGCESLYNTDFLSNATNLTTIGKKAFSACCWYNKEKNEDNLLDQTIYGEWEYSGLERVNLPDSVETIGEECFSENYALVDVNLGSGITTIPTKAFAVTDKSHSMLQRIILSDNLRTIESEAFKNNQRLRTIGSTSNGDITLTAGKANLPNGLNYIGDNAFAGCGYRHALKNLYKKSTSIKAVAYEFDDADILEEETEGYTPYLVYEEGDSDMKLVYLNLDTAHEELSDPSVTPAPDAAPYSVLYVFAEKAWVDNTVTATPDPDGKNMAETLEFGNPDYGYGNYITNVKKEYTNEQLSSTPIKNAEEVYRLNNSKSGVSLTFYIYTGLTDISLPSTLQDTDTENSLGIGVFKDCISLNSVNMSTSVRNLPKDTFSGCGDMIQSWKEKKTIEHKYYGLKSVTGLRSRLETVGENAFNNCYNFDLEQSEDGGEISDTLVTIGANAFYNCRSLTSVVFHSALETIGDAAFKNCGEVSKDDLTFEYDNAAGTTQKYSYKQVADPKDVGGKGLTRVDFTYASALSSIGKEAFAYTALKSVNLPKTNYDSILDSTFEGCSLLKSASIPSNVTKIGKKVFKDCQSLTSLNMPATATIESDILRGMTPSVISGLQLNNTYTEKISVPLEQAYTLPIKAFKPSTRTGSYKVTVYENEYDKTGTVIYNDGENVEGDYYEGIIDVEINYGTETKPDVINLIGGTVGKKDLIVKVEANSAFSVLGGDTGSIINAQTYKFNVDVTAIPATGIDVTETAGYTYLKETDASGNEVNQLYMSKDQTATLEASLIPSLTTDNCRWILENTKIATITEEINEQGVSTIKLTANASGNTKVTVKCGSISKDIYVYVKVPYSSMQAKTDSSVQTSSDTSFELAVNDTEKITLTTNYNGSRYSEQEWKDYPDTVKYTSSDSSIATVTTNGFIQALASGNVTITALALASKKRINFNITVVDPSDYNPLNGRNIVDIEGTDNVYINSTVALKAVLNPIKARNKVKWSITSGEGTIDEDGIFEADDTPGYTTVTATMYDENNKLTNIKFSKTISILQAANFLKLTEAVKDVSLFSGQTYSINKTKNETVPGYYLEPDTSTDTVDIISSDENVASCSVSGTRLIIKGVGQGTAMITLKSSSGTTQTIPVKVTAPITSITLPETKDVELGTSISLKPVFEPANSTETLKWYSSKDKVATVDENGKVTAVSIGTATITVSGQNASSTCKITVTSSATAIDFNDYTKNLVAYTGESTILYRNPNDTSAGYTITPTDSTDNVTCTSSDESKATCEVKDDNSILINGLAQGTTELKITADSGVSNTFKLNVVHKITNITLPEKISVNIGGTSKINPVLEPADSMETFTWKSDNTDVATVDENGNVTGVGQGTTTITVSTKKKISATCQVYVSQQATAINLTAVTNNITMFAGESISLAKTTNKDTIGYNLEPSTSNEEVTCSSSDANIVTCEKKGSKFEITAKGQGSANIILKTPSGVQNSFAITVTTPITAISIPKELSIVKGTTANLTPQITPADSKEPIKFATSNKDVATVSDIGVITAVGTGTTKITVSSSKGVRATCEITVTNPITSITPKTNTNQKTIYIIKDSTTRIGCGYTPKDTTDTITYTSTNTKVATVSGSSTSATVKAIKPGTAKIQIVSSSGASTTITVVVAKKNTAAKKVAISGKSSQNVNVAGTLQLTAKLTGKKSTDTITWSSSDSSIATVDSFGTVTGKKQGVSIITATSSSGKEASVILIVGKPKLPSGKLVIKGKKTVKKGKALVLKAKLSSKKSLGTVIWSTSNSKVATVSGGRITGVKKGSCQITAYATCGKKATIKIKVK